MEKKVAIFGTSITSAYLSGATMLFRAMVQSFLDKGWEVTFIEEDHEWLETTVDYSTDIDGLTIERFHDQESLLQILNKDIFRMCKLVLKFSGGSIEYDQFTDRWLAEYKEEVSDKVKVIYIDADAPMRLPYMMNHPKFYLNKIISRYDGVCVILGGERAIKGYESIGAKNVFFIPAFIDPKSFNPKTVNKQFEADLLFIGNPTLGREESLRNFFFELATNCPEMTFLLAGAEWNKMKLPSNVKYLGYVPSDQLAELYSSPRMVLNVTREEMAAYGDAASLRLFESTICGACLVSDKWVGIDKLFEPNKEILLIDTKEDMLQLLKTITWEQSRQIGKAARERVLKEHTSDIRLDQFLNNVGL